MVCANHIITPFSYSETIGIDTVYASKDAIIAIVFTKHPFHHLRLSSVW